MRMQVAQRLNFEARTDQASNPDGLMLAVDKFLSSPDYF
jgi:hypothetical protein